MNKILIVPTRRHIAEAYYEYLIRYLSDEFIIDQAYSPYPPYEEFDADPFSNGNNPTMKNPDDYDLIIPHFTTHWNVWGDRHWADKSKNYTKKIGLVVFEPEGFNNEVAVVGATTPAVEEGYGDSKFHSLRFGVDLDLFKPFPMAREDNLLHVGFVGNWLTPRRYLKDLFIPLHNVEGVKLMISPINIPANTRPDEIESVGGSVFLEAVKNSRGDIWYSGLPNIYNQFDVLVRCDIDPGYHFPVLEAAACGVPTICVDSKFCPELVRYGGGITTGNGDGSWSKDNLRSISNKIIKEIEFLRDNHTKRKEMGIKARKFMEENYNWNKLVPAWRNFLREGLLNAKRDL